MNYKYDLKENFLCLKFKQYLLKINTFIIMYFKTHYFNFITWMWINDDYYELGLYLLISIYYYYHYEYYFTYFV